MSVALVIAPKSFRQESDESAARAVIAADVVMDSVNAPKTPRFLGSASTMYVPAPMMRSVLETRVGKPPGSAGASSRMYSGPDADVPRVR